MAPDNGLLELFPAIPAEPPSFGQRTRLMSVIASEIVVSSNTVADNTAKIGELMAAVADNTANIGELVDAVAGNTANIGELAGAVKDVKKRLARAGKPEVSRPPDAEATEF